jgi:4-amino-4-deoxychorismate lyase
VILINGKQTRSVDVLDRGLQYGDGLFETIAVVNGRPRLWHSHMERLEEGCRRLRLPPPDLQLLADEAGQVLQGREGAILKLLITRGPGGRGYRVPEEPAVTRVTAVFPAPDYPAHFYDEGIAVRLCETPLGHSPALAGIKHLNRLEQVVARSEWNDPGIPEGLMLDVDGNVAEGTMSNVFLRRGDRLQTPPVNRCGVAGVMRKWVMEHGCGLGLQVEVSPITLEAIHGADEVFLTNAVIGIWPVRRLEGTEYRQRVAARNLNRQLTEEFDA